MILLVSSKKDHASLNIKEQILNNYPFRQTSQFFQRNPIYCSEAYSRKLILITLQDESVTAQTLPENFPDANLVVFISRHSSQSGKPTLSVHTPGNFGAADLGGLPKTLSISAGCAMVNALEALVRFKEELRLDYEVSFEVTHHGPSLKVPTLFVELGSSPVQWSDLKAAEAVAHATFEVVSNFGAPTSNAAIGIGGTHYNQKFTQMALEGKEVFGHMVPKYAVSQLDSEMLRQCVEKSLEKITVAILDWKGIKSEDKPGLISALDEVGLPFKKV